MIDEISLKCFRKHEDRTFTFSKGMNVVRAENEAGKSTLLSAILYLFFGTKALGQPLDEVVTYGHLKKELKVSGRFTVDGVDYTAYRSDGGAELAYGDQRVTGQTAVTRFMENLFGANVDTVRKLLVAEQNAVRGALDSEAGAGALIESLAELDRIDDLISKIKHQRPCGPIKAAEAVAKNIRDSIPEVTKKPSRNPVIVAKAWLDSAKEDFNKAETAFHEASQDAKVAQQGLVTIDAELQNRARVLSRKVELENVKHPGQKPWSEAELAEASAQEADASRAEFIAKQRNVKFKTHEASFDGDAVEGLKQLELKLKAEEAKAARVSFDIQNLRIKRINEGQCSFCKKDLTDVPEVLKNNASIEAELVPLKAEQVQLQRVVAELKSDMTIVKQLLTVEAANMRLAHPDFWEKSSGTVPSTFKWIGPEEPIVGHIPVPFSKMVSDNLTHENLVKQYENALSELAGLVIPEDRSSEKPKLLQIIQRAEELAENVKKSREELFDCNLEFQKAESAYAAELLRHEESISNRQARLDELAKSEALIEEMEFHNELIKDLSAARSEIRRRLWKIVSAAISHYFTRIRGEATIVEQGEDGFTENGRPVKGLSGSAKDTLGLAVRAALSRVFIPGAPLMIVDEPFAACDSVREVAGIGVLAGLGFDQTILVTHSDLADSVADKIIHL